MISRYPFPFCRIFPFYYPKDQISPSWPIRQRTRKNCLFSTLRFSESSPIPLFILLLIKIKTTFSFLSFKRWYVTFTFFAFGFFRHFCYNFVMLALALWQIIRVGIKIMNCYFRFSIFFNRGWSVIVLGGLRGVRGVGMIGFEFRLLYIIASSLVITFFKKFLKIQNLSLIRLSFALDYFIHFLLMLNTLCLVCYLKYLDFFEQFFV